MSSMKWVGMVSSLFAVLLWATIPSLVKVSLTSFSVSQMLIWRFTVSSLVLSPVCISIFPKLKRISIGRWCSVALNIALGLYFQNIALQNLPASYYIVIFSLSPLITLAYLFQPIKGTEYIPLILVIVGVLGFVTLSQFDGPLDKLSLFFLFCGMCSWVWYTVQAKNLQNVFSDLEFTALTSLLSLLVVFPVWLMVPHGLRVMDSRFILVVVLLGLVTPAAYFSFLFAYRLVPIFTVLSQYLEPVFGLIICYLVLGDTISHRQKIASSLIIAGMGWLGMEQATSG